VVFVNRIVQWIGGDCECERTGIAGELNFVRTFDAGSGFCISQTRSPGAQRLSWRRRSQGSQAGRAFCAVRVVINEHRRYQISNTVLGVVLFEYAFEIVFGVKNQPQTQ
jgi:hypothetical protein